MRPSYWRGEVLAGAAVVTLALVVVGARVALREEQGAPDARPAVIDVNTASKDALTALPGVGPVAAERIVAGRPYAAVDDLRTILGDHGLAAARPYLTIAAVSSR